MIVTFWKGVFVVDRAETPTERTELKRAGFELHEPSICPLDKRCKACRANIGSRYWSDKVESATRMRPYCNALALATMKDHLAKLAKSRATTSDLVVPAPPGLVFKPFQRAGVAYMLAHKDTYNGDDMGLGKDQPLDAKILTPCGWTTMGEIKVGEGIVGSDGNTYPVTGVYPQGVRKVFRVTFQDGASTECGANHLWSVNSFVRLQLGFPWNTLKTRHLKDVGLIGEDGKPRFFIPLIQPQTLQELVDRHGHSQTDLPSSKNISPYRTITKIEPIGPRETQCIAVASPDHLYVTDDFILTHNTIQTMGFLNCLRTTNPNLNTLILAPSTLAFNWRDEAQKWLIPGPTGLPEIVIPASAQFEVPRRDNLLVITNYEKMVRDSLLTDSLKRVWDVLVCDEAQALKNWAAQRTQAVLGQEGLMQRAHRSVFLSGTPIENYPKEIWTIAAAICPAKFGDWWAYAKRYCGLHQEVTTEGRTRMVDTGATHLGELQQRLRSTFMIRRLKSDVLKELPPKRRQLIVLGDSKVDWSRDPDFARWKELYEKDYEQRLAALEAAHTRDAYKQAVRQLDAFTGVAFKDMSALRHKTALAKLDACITYIDQILETGIDKLVIFAHHQDVLQKLALHYGPAAVSMSGETKQSERDAVKKRFQDTPTRDGGARIFIGGLKVAGVGLNLFAASTVIFIEIDWNPATLTQAEDRLCRIGQTKMVHVIHLILDGTLDVSIVKKVVAKQEVVDKALNREPEHGLKLTRQTVMALRC